MTEAKISTAPIAHPELFTSFGTVSAYGDPVHIPGSIDIYHLGSDEKGSVEVVQKYGHENKEITLARIFPQKTEEIKTNDLVIKVEHS